jgi:hypothetical protein
MDSSENTKPGERKVMRRGLLAGLAGLGAAALLKVTGGTKPEFAEASPTALLIPGGAPDGPTLNTAYNETVLSLASGVSDTVALQIYAIGGAPSFRDAVYAFAGGNNGVGLYTVGSGGTGTGGYGVWATGGNGNNGSAAVFAQGGSGTTGGSGIHATGGSGAVKNGDGVQGFSTSGKGVYGQSTSSDGVHGTSSSGVGLRGTSSGFVGLVGISDQNIGLYGFTVAPNMPALYAEHLGQSGRIAARFYGDVQIQGTLTATAKNAVVTMADGSEALLYCQEAPEPYFEDFGRAQLTNGVARVQLEPEFASLVKRDDYMVFALPMGDCKGLYVSRQDGVGFEVRELQAGASNAGFTYRIVAKRKDIEGKRLARLDPKVKQNIARMRTESAAKMPAAAMAGRTEAPLVPHDPILPIEVPKPDIERRR